MDPPRTPDGRYIVHFGRAGARLWRASNPDLSSEVRKSLTQALMDARRQVKSAGGDPKLLSLARRQVDEIKRKLGERGPIWWDDGSPDLNRKLVKNSPYRDWWQSRLAQASDPPPLADAGESTDDQDKDSEQADPKY